MGLEGERFEASIPTQKKQRRNSTNFPYKALENSSSNQQGLKLKQLRREGSGGICRTLVTRPAPCPTSGGHRTADSDICAKATAGKDSTLPWSPSKDTKTRTVPSYHQSFHSKNIEKRKSFLHSSQAL